MSRLATDQWRPDSQSGFAPPRSVEPHTHDAAAIVIAGTPVGVIWAYYGATAPVGWLLCDGAAIPAQYVALITLVGANTPNLKGKVVVGVDAAQTEFDVLGETGGAKTHTLTATEMPVHTHVQNSHLHDMNGRPDDPTSTGSWFNDVEQTTQGIQATQTAPATPTNQNAGSGGAHNNLQPYMAINYIIKAA